MKCVKVGNMQGHNSVLPPLLPCDSNKELSWKPVIQRRLTAVPRLSLNHPLDQSFTCAGCCHSLLSAARTAGGVNKRWSLGGCGSERVGAG